MPSWRPAAPRRRAAAGTRAARRVPRPAPASPGHRPRCRNPRRWRPPPRSGVRRPTRRSRARRRRSRRRPMPPATRTASPPRRNRSAARPASAGAPGRPRLRYVGRARERGSARPREASSHRSRARFRPRSRTWFPARWSPAGTGAARRTGRRDEARNSHRGRRRGLRRRRWASRGSAGTASRCDHRARPARRFGHRRSRHSPGSARSGGRPCRVSTSPTASGEPPACAARSSDLRSSG